jgi:hypothetical protein
MFRLQVRPTNSVPWPVPNSQVSAYPTPRHTPAYPLPMTKFLHTADGQLGMTRHFLKGEAQARFSGSPLATSKLTPRSNA